MVTRTIDTAAPVGRSRISWGAIFAATAVSLAVWLLLYVFGLAVGLSALDPTDPSSLRNTGIGTGAWSVISMIIALFAGGVVAARESSTVNKLDAGIHGVVVWALTAILGLLLVSALLTSVVGGAARFLGGTASLAGQAVSGAAQGAGQGTLASLGISTEEILAPINQRLRAEGRPEVTAAGLQASLEALIMRAAREGDLTRSDVVATVAANTNLSRQDAEAIASQVMSQWEAQSGQLQQRLESAATTATDVTASTMWWLGFSLLLSLMAAVGGAILGATRRRRADVIGGEYAPVHG